ncbi:MULTISPECIES: hypothetical protein [unclassified Sporosarcina]|uniref:hypothetical protein n=1 Tax=unclassified Sporosarcina TaxID=2647733 RepID=UPI0012DCAE53|nr:MULTISPECIES: hypothetical protein [unclassified Sporosarcina]
MHLFLAGLANLVILSLLIQLMAGKEMERIFIPLCKVAIGIWILQYILQFASHKYL